MQHGISAGYFVCISCDSNSFFLIICTISFEIHWRKHFVDKVDLGIQISMIFKNVSFHRCQHSSIEEENMWSKLISFKSSQAVEKSA